MMRFGLGNTAVNKFRFSAKPVIWSSSYHVRTNAVHSQSDAIFIY